MARVVQQPAFVLHARPYRETSLLVELLTRDHGRVAVVARGAKRTKSKTRNIVQQFRPLLVDWSARGELGTMHGAEQIAAPPVLQGEALYCGLYLNELLIRLLHRNDPHPDVFERYRAVLAELAGSASVQPALRLFEKHLLEAVGYGLILDHEAGSERPLQADARYDYRPGDGPVRLGDAQVARRAGISGAALLALHTEHIDPEWLPELRRLMRRQIGYHLGDKPLVSASLFPRQAKSRKIEHG